MEVGRQIKKYRIESNLSQEALAEKIFVTRQTISNWENDRNYPDINSLLLLSDLFDTSLDNLVKGDLEEMKEQVKKEQVKSEDIRGDIRKMKSDSTVFSLLLTASVVMAVPMFWYLGWIGIAGWAVLYGFTMYYAGKLEKQKKKHDVHTYKEILAFMEGRELDPAQHNQEYGKRPYQKAFLVTAAAGITLAVLAAAAGLINIFSG